MSEYFKNIREKIRSLAKDVETYTKDAIVPSVPSAASVNRAKKLIDKGQYEEARDLLLEATKLPNPGALVYKYLGTAYDKLQDWDNAVPAYQASAALNPDDKDIWAKLAFVLYLTEQFENARKSFENANRLRPMNHDTLTGWGMTLLKMDFYEEAREKLDLAVKLNKNNKMTVMLLAIAYKYLGDYGKANTYLASLVKTAPDGINTHEYAELRYLCGDYEDAEYYAKKSIEFYADILGPYVLLGKIYTHKCERETAMAYFQTALDRNLVNEELYIAWTDAFIRFGEYDEAYKKALEGLKTMPEDLILHDRLALCNALKGAKTTQPGVSDIVRGITAYNNKDFQTTIEVLDINAAEEKDAIKCYYLAKAYGWVNDFERACGYYEEALEKNPVFVDARLDFVKYLISKEKYTDARYKLRKAPKMPEFEELAAFVESKL